MAYANNSNKQGKIAGVMGSLVVVLMIGSWLNTTGQIDPSSNEKGWIASLQIEDGAYKPSYNEKVQTLSKQAISKN